MTIDQYNICLAEMPNYADPDAYISDLALSSIWGDPEDAVDIPAQRVSDLLSLWEAAHRSIKDIASEAGLSVRRTALSFGVPIRTVENWASGTHPMPVYISLMMQEALGLIGVDIDR